MPQNTIYYSTEANAKHWAQCAPREWACTVDCRGRVGVRRSGHDQCA